MADGHSSPASFDLEALLKPSSPLTPRESVEAFCEVFNVIATPHLQDAIGEEIKRRRVAYADWQRQCARARVLSALGPDPFDFPTAAQILEVAQAGAASKVAYLNSNIGKARRKLAEFERRAQDACQAALNVGAALSRGDGSAIKRAEELRDLTQDLRLIAAEVETFCRLVQDEADAAPGPEAA